MILLFMLGLMFSSFVFAGSVEKDFWQSFNNACIQNGQAYYDTGAVDHDHMKFLKSFPDENLYKYNLGNNYFLIKYANGGGQRVCSTGALEVNTSSLYQSMMDNKNLRYIKSAQVSGKYYKFFQISKSNNADLMMAQVSGKYYKFFQAAMSNNTDLVILSYSSFGDSNSKVVLSFQKYSNLPYSMKKFISD